MEAVLSMLVQNKYIVSFIPFLIILFGFAIKYLKKCIEDVKIELSTHMNVQAEKFTENFRELYNLHRDTLKNYMHKKDIYHYISDSKNEIYKYVQDSKHEIEKQDSKIDKLKNDFYGRDKCS